MNEISNTIRLKLFELYNRKDVKIYERDYFYLNVIEIACSLYDLAIINKRKIEHSEKYWFEGSYHMSFDFTSGILKELYELYGELIDSAYKKNLI